MEDRLLIHLHIPKNAGTTLGRMLKLKLGFWPPGHLLRHARTLGFYPLPGFENRIEAIDRLPERQRRRVRLFEAHAGFGLHERLPQPSAYLTMLREPIDRALSVYFFLRQEGLIGDDLTIEQFVLDSDPQRVWWVDNAQVRYLAGEQGRIVSVKQGTCTSDLLEVAKARLDEHFLFVGIMEQFDASIVLLRRALGWRSLRYVTSNVTRSRKRAEDLPPSTREFLREHNALDVELYRYAVKRFESRISSAGASFPAELAGFQAANRRYNRWAGPVYGVLPRGRRLLSRMKIVR